MIDGMTISALGSAPPTHLAAAAALIDELKSDGLATPVWRESQYLVIARMLDTSPGDALLARSFTIVGEVVRLGRAFPWDDAVGRLVDGLATATPTRAIVAPADEATPPTRSQ